MYAQQSLNRLVYRATRASGSSLKSLSSMSSGSSLCSSPPRCKLRSGNESRTRRSCSFAKLQRRKSSLLSISESPIRSKSGSIRSHSSSLHDVSGVSLDSFSQTRDPKESSYSFLSYILSILTTCYLDRILIKAVVALQKNVHRFPFLMRFGFVRVLVKKGKSSDFHLPREEELYAIASDHTIPSRGALESLTRNTRDWLSDELFSPAKVLPAPSVDPNDEWGHFADFQEEQTLFKGSNVGDPFQSVLGKGGDSARCLSPLTESVDED